MLRCQYRTISIVQYLRCSGAKQRSAEKASVCGHDDEVESVRPRELSDLCRCNARQQDSRALTDWKLRLEERVCLEQGSAALRQPRTVIAHRVALRHDCKGRRRGPMSLWR